MSLNHDFYDGRRWHRKCDWAIRFYGRRCMKCDATNHIEVDHIIARGRGWFGEQYQYSRRNLQVLCHDCNQTKGVKFADYRPWWARLLLPIKDERSRTRCKEARF
jgi:5-methylcytosine-specific restriction endonuclease McrA